MLRSSKKNFLVVAKPASLRPAGSPDRQKAASGDGDRRKKRDDDDPCVQFGKVRSGRFNLDFRYPVSPVQAFSMALSMFGWQGK